jgi:hypothetical protein
MDPLTTEKMVSLGRGDLDVKSWMMGESSFEPRRKKLPVLGPPNLLLNFRRFHKEPSTGSS